MDIYETATELNKKIEKLESFKERDPTHTSPETGKGGAGGHLKSTDPVTSAVLANSWSDRSDSQKLGRNRSGGGGSREKATFRLQMNGVFQWSTQVG